MAAVHGLNPRADLLRKEQALAANVNAARGLQDILASNLGPKGTLKMLVGGAGQIKITKDGNVLLKEMHIQHPTAALIARAATAQDVVTGDGSTSAILMMGEIMKLAEREISEGLHPRLLIEGLELAREEVLKFVDGYARRFSKIYKDRELMENIARCSLITKLDTKMADSLTRILVDSVLCLIGEDHEKFEREREEGKISLDLFMVEVLAMKQGLSHETKFIKGMVMDHGCRHPDMPSSLKNSYILTCNVSLEYEKTEVNSAFFYNSAEQRAKLADAERRFTDMRVQKIIDLKRQVCTEENKRSFVVLNQKGIDPPALAMLAREGIMALRRVKRRNMERLTFCCGGVPLNCLDNMSESDLGFADSVWEVSIGDEKYTFVEGVKNPRSCAILVMAPNDHELEQIKDAIRDGLRALKLSIDDGALLPGAGSTEIACYEHLMRFMTECPGRARIGVKVFAEALLTIPKSLARNAGFDPQKSLIDMQERFHKEAKAGNKNPEAGLDIVTGGVCVPSLANIWDSIRVKKQMLVLVPTLASQLLLVDEIIKAGKQMGRGQ